MSDKTNYPARGKMSDDGRIYTHTDGTVNERVDFTTCRDCAFHHHRITVGCFQIACGCDMFKRIEGAYVQSDDELAACEMAMAMIEICPRAPYTEDTCIDCPYLKDKTCPARAYLASKGDQTAWEVKE